MQKYEYDFIYQTLPALTKSIKELAGTMKEINEMMNTYNTALKELHETLAKFKALESANVDDGR